MEIRNAIYKTVPVRNLTFPLAAGTVVTAGGTLANSDGSDAYGIVPETVAILPLTKRLYVAVAGTIDLATCGATFSDAMIKALGEDFNFVPAKEEHEPPAPELPVVDSGDNGKVLTVVSGAWAAANSPVPAVTGTDNGKVLKVVEGSWSAAPRDTGALYITATLVDTSWSLDASYNDIAAALAAGKSVFMAMDNSSSGKTETKYDVLNTLTVYDGGTGYGAAFGSFSFAASGADDDMVEA